MSAATSREPVDRKADVRAFGPFRLDVRDERLWRGDREVKLRRKPFAILKHLTANPRRLVTHEEIVEAVWGRIAMSESLLRTHICDVRRALGEGFLETIVGRGYRFLHDVAAERRPVPSLRQVEAPTTSGLVGRREEMAELRYAFDKTLRAARQVVFVTGEPGVGKTALVDAFLAAIAVPRGALVVSGSCFEHLGAGEAYLPVLAALAAACRGFEGDRVVETLGRHAPTWLAQMPGLVKDADLEALLLRVQGATQARMLRELAEALDVLAADKPVVLVLEDVQWADRSTVDLIATLGTRREASRVIVVATCRQAELTKGEGVAKTIAQLGAHKQALALHLENWQLPAVAEYLALRFSQGRFPDDLAATLREMTDGNPLFTIAMLDDLESRQMIRSVDGVYQLTTSIVDVASRRPDTVRQLIDIQIDRLGTNEQRVLEAASTVGAHFTADAVARALALPADEVDSVCERFANEGRFLRFVTTEATQDGAVPWRFGFVHELYRDAALTRVPAGTRRVWHRRVAGLQAVQSESPAAATAPARLHEAQPFIPLFRQHGSSCDPLPAR